MKFINTSPYKIRVRSWAGLDGEIVDLIPQGGLIDTHDAPPIEKDGYIWRQLLTGYWVAIEQVDGIVFFTLVDDTPSPEPLPPNTLILESDWHQLTNDTVVWESAGVVRHVESGIRFDIILIVNDTEYRVFVIAEGASDLRLETE